MGGWDKFNTIAMWMLKIAYLNLLWILFTFTGLIVFGLFPATGSMFEIVRKWMNQERDVRIFHEFWKNYRKEFIRLNGFALIFIAVGYFLYYDITFLRINSGEFQLLIPVLIFIGVSYFITLLFFFPVYVHFDLKFFQYIKQSFLIAMTSPLEILLMIISVIALYIAVLFLPGIIPLFTGSVLAIAITFLSKRAFRRIERKKGLL
ncbi:hypothetical protein CIL03_11895 [Virgibacillus indicus]|uniref:DUF624 domain-containing protein n=1 Tax=Virgibacillus indicus TaxID=2024554 RepID=A0A265NAM0_9BACI|nr:YesL family protein [Virgibacillus indicus]OZU88346.1 hypothetical protein CIL03_11895 [Virgibacillus indicus]